MTTVLIHSRKICYSAARKNCNELASKLVAFSLMTVFLLHRPTTPLIVAVKHGHVGVVSLLLAANAQVDLADGYAEH